LGCRIQWLPRSVASAAIARENLFASLLVWTGDMRPLTATMDHGPVGTAPADASRRTRFAEAARPGLDRAYRIAGLLLGNAAEAEDAVQDALAVAWQSFDRLRKPDRFGAWFDRIVVNGCRDRLRRRGIVRFVPIEAGGEPAARDPFQAFLDRDVVLAGLARLTDDERAVVVLRFWADLSLDEIADRLDVPTGTVKSRLHRAIGKLRDALAAVGEDRP
jgi:RNA polymerase sigma-70 factor (sigma-E family)